MVAAVIGAGFDTFAAVIAHEAVSTNALYASLGGTAHTAGRSGAVIRALKLDRAINASPTRLTDAEVLTTADAVLSAALAAGRSLRAVFASVVRIAEALSIEALAVSRAAGGAAGSLLAGGTLKAREAEATTAVAAASTVAVVLAGDLNGAIVSSVTGVADATTAQAGTLAVALARALALGESSTGILVTSLRAVSSCVGRQAAAASEDAYTAEGAFVGAVEGLRDLRAVDSRVTRKTGASAIEAHTGSGATIGALLAQLNESADGILVQGDRGGAVGGALGAINTEDSSEAGSLSAVLAIEAGQTATFALHADAVAAATVRTRGVLVAGSALGAGIAVTASSEADTASRASAVSGALFLERAREALATFPALTTAIMAAAETTADDTIGALGALHNFGAVRTEVARSAVALATDAISLARAIIEAGVCGKLCTAISTSETRRAEAFAIKTESFVVAVIGASTHLRAGFASEAGIAVAFASVTGTMTSANSTTKRGALERILAVVTSIAGLAEALSKLAVTSTVALSGTTLNRAVDASISWRASTHSSVANTVARAVVLADLRVSAIASHQRAQKALATKCFITKLSWRCVGGQKRGGDKKPVVDSRATVYLLKISTLFGHHSL